jgi:hypothetical protein
VWKVGRGFKALWRHQKPSILRKKNQEIKLLFLCSLLGSLPTPLNLEILSWIKVIYKNKEDIF